MIAYTLRRLVWLVFVILGLLTITFAISRLVPSDPARMVAGLEAGPEQIERARIELGMDRPVLEQYVSYITGLFRGDLGRSIATRRPVVQDLRTFLPATLELVFLSMVVIIVVGVGLGLLSASSRGTWVDLSTRFGTYLGLGMPVFWLGMMAQIILYYRLGWFPIGSRLPLDASPPPTVTGFYTIDSLLVGDIGLFLTVLHYAALPVLTLALGRMAVVARMTHTSLLETLTQDYVRTARSKGLKESAVVFRHSLRNASVPVLTTLGVQFGFLLGGTLLVERVFTWPGIGLYAVQSVQFFDFPAIMGVALVICIGFVLSNLAIDLLYKVADPRIQY